jgi:hypothetical protein
VRSDDAGVTLPNVVEEVRSHLAPQSDAGLILDDNLIAYGYLNMHSSRYTNTYTVRYVDCVEVTANFSRIRERDLDEGLGEVSYSLALSACEACRVDVNEALARIALATP